jgi:hypothetical protein
MEGGSIDRPLDLPVERPVLDQFQVEVGRTLADRVQSHLTGDDREERRLHVVDEAAAISARFNDRLPCERNGTSDSSLSRATTSTVFPLTTVAFGQSRVDTTSGPVTAVVRRRAQGRSGPPAVVRSRRSTQ